MYVHLLYNYILKYIYKSVFKVLKNYRCQQIKMNKYCTHLKSFLIKKYYNLNYLILIITGFSDLHSSFILILDGTISSYLLLLMFGILSLLLMIACYDYHCHFLPKS
jgi:hypothetical protein